MKFLHCLIATLFVIGLSSTSTLARELFVSPSGNDANTGTRDAPFATLSRARNALREGRAGPPRTNAPATIWIAPGRYVLQDSLVLDARDSHCRWVAQEGSSSVVISGGRTMRLKDIPLLRVPELLRRIPAQPADIRVLDLKALGVGNEFEKPWPDAFRGYGGWPELFVDGEALRLARWPNEGYAKIARVLERGSRPRHNEKPDRPGSFLFGEDEPTQWDPEQEIYLSGYWCFGWYDEVLRVARFDPESKSVHLAAPHHYGVGGPSGGLYHSLNVLETLDMPGEYVIDRAAGRIYLLAPKGDDNASLTVSLLHDPLIQAKGAIGIRFLGLELEASRGDGIHLEDCVDCLVKSAVQHVAGWGVRVVGGRGCVLEDCEIASTGCGGVLLSGGERATLTPSAHVVRSCWIHHYARLVRTYQPAVSLGGVGQVVEFCDIHDAPHQAISFSGNDHRIRNNKIERVCLDTGDAGAIYCGRDWTLGGTVIEQNWFARIGEGAHHHNWAVYPDDQASGLTVRHNVVVDCPSGFLFGGGRSNVIENNLFVGVGQWSIRFDARGMGWGKVSEPTLLKGLASVPTDSPVWRSRFPWLLGLADDPKRNWPLENRVEGNLFVDSHPPSYDKAVREGGTLRDNERIKREEPWAPELRQGRLWLPPDGPELPEELRKMRAGRTKE